VDREASEGLLRLSLSLAVEARDAFWENPAHRVGRLRPLVAASIGPFGAFLADGSEYTGRYEISDQELYDFHRERWEILADGEADLMACETIPSLREAEVLVRLVAESPGIWAWISFSCSDGEHLCDGSLLSDAARACDAEPRVAAIGINCTKPELVPPLLDEARRGTTKLILAYPNSGEVYGAEDKEWTSMPSPIALEEAAEQWVREGVAGVGGCCRVGPDTIRKIRRRVVQP
jgi:homocysteine S-methyltransferase